MMTIDDVKIVMRSDEYMRDLRQASLKGLVRVAALTRVIARRSIRKRKGPSRPGRPPHSHTGLLKRHIYFWPDRKGETVDIGAAALGGTRSDDIPGVLEQGGRAKAARVQPRPYMGPALDKSKEQLKDILRA